MIDKFMDEFDILLKKYSIDDVILVNMDDKAMGFQQMFKMVNDEGGRNLLILSYSGKGVELCPCCSGKDMEHFINAKNPE